MGGWLAIAVLLGIAEMFSLDLVLIMLAAGALGGMATEPGRPTRRGAVPGRAAFGRACSPLVRPASPGASTPAPSCTLGHGAGRSQGVVPEQSPRWRRPGPAGRRDLVRADRTTRLTIEPGERSRSSRSGAPPRTSTPYSDSRPEGPRIRQRNP